MNSEEVQALNRVLAHYGHDDMRHYQDAGEPSGHIARSLLVLEDYMRHLAPPVEEVASRPNGEDTGGSPIGIVRDHPSHDEDLRSKSVVDRGSREIKVRWAKETIGLVAVQLNEVYAQFEIRRDGCEIPGGLSRAAERLGEVLQCLRIGSNLDDEIPF